MSQLDKIRARLRTKPRDLSYDEVRSFLSKIGFTEYNKGKTSGSRVKFYRESDRAIIMLHKPHPGSILSPGAIDDLVEHLKEIGEL